jgi:hypothetical protein
VITNIGKGILAKYLIGQTPSYASYMAVGCGPQALNSEGPGFTAEQRLEYAAKKSLDFEMFRIPIISRGYVNENNLTKLVLTAELPTEERYEITEVGIFSAEANPSAGAFDSKNFSLFNQTEGWEYHTSSDIEEIPTVYTPLDSNEDNIIDDGHIVNGSLRATPVFHTNADNRTFTNSERVSRNERCRFLNNMLMISGDNAFLTTDSTQQLSVVLNSNSNHIHKAGTSLTFNRNAPTDKIKLAFSLVSKNGDSSNVPDNIKILVQFSSSDTSSEGEYANFAVNIDDVNFSSGTAMQKEDLSENRYFVVSKELQELYYTSAFNWGIVNVTKIYVQVEKDGQPSSDYFVALDAMRLENLTTTNPLYGMTGYSVLKTDGAIPVVKASNTSNYLEFRIAIGVE